jgi:hypothetical protein
VILLPHTQEIGQKVSSELESRRLLTTQVQVVAPRYLKIGIQITLVLKPDAKEEDVQLRAVDALKQFFDPYQGGTDGKGWQFGRDVYVSEIYDLLDKVAGVDYVQRTGTLDEIKVEPAYVGRRQVVMQGQQEFLTAIALELDELIDAQIDPADIQLVSPLQRTIQTT